MRDSLCYLFSNDRDIALKTIGHRRKRKNTVRVISLNVNLLSSISSLLIYDVCAHAYVFIYIYLKFYLFKYINV